MQRKKAIIVCSAYQSQTSESIVSLIRHLCPSQEVTFLPLEKRTRFDGRKVVFCHSSLSGPLALTDFNYSIYDKAVKDASKTVGKENVSFVVTDVEAADTKLRRKMITQTQHTLMSNIHLLLLLSKVDVNEDMVRDNFTEFLTRTSLVDHVEQQSDYRTFPGSYDLLKSLPQLAIMVLIIACFASVNSRLDLFESHIKLVRKESFERMNHLERTLNYLEEKVNNTLQLRFEISTLGTSLREGMNDHRMRLQTEVENRIVDVQTALKNTLEVHRSELQSLGTSLWEGMNDHMMRLQTEVENKMVDVQIALTKNLEVHTSELQSLGTSLWEGMNDHRMRLQTEVENKMVDVHIALTKNLEVHTSELQSLGTSLREGMNDHRMRLQTEVENKMVDVQIALTKNLEVHTSELQSLGTSLREGMNDHRMRLQTEVENKMVDVQTALTKQLEVNKAELQSNLYNRINDVQTSIQKTIESEPLRQQALKEKQQALKKKQEEEKLAKAAKEPEEMFFF